MNCKGFMLLCMAILAAAHTDADELPPGVVLQGKEVFESVTGGIAEPDKMQAVVRHDMEFFSKIVKDNTRGQVGNYFIGLLKWIEENGDETYLPFLEEIVADLDHTDPVKHAAEYLDRYARGDLYRAAAEAWFTIKTRTMSDDEKIDLIIESLRQDAGIPKVLETVWRRYEEQLAGKRDEIYSALMMTEINKDYFNIARGINIWGLFGLKGLAPTEDEVHAIMEMEGRALLKSDMISYFMEKRDRRHLDIFVPYILEQYRKTETYKDLRRYDNVLYMYLTRCGTDKETSAKIQKMITDKMRKYPEPWKHPFPTEELKTAAWMAHSITFIKKDHMTEETRAFLKQYRDAIKARMGNIYDGQRESLLKEMLKNLNQTLGEPWDAE